jgi:hypothetical protein
VCACKYEEQLKVEHERPRPLCCAVLTERFGYPDACAETRIRAALALKCLSARNKGEALAQGSAECKSRAAPAREREREREREKERKKKERKRRERERMLLSSPFQKVCLCPCVSACVYVHAQARQGA